MLMRALRFCQADAKAIDLCSVSRLRYAALGLRGAGDPGAKVGDEWGRGRGGVVDVLVREGYGAFSRV